MPHLIPSWLDRDDANGVAGTSLESANLCRVHPSVNALHKQFLQPSAQRRGFILKEESAIKIIYQGRHYVCANKAGIPFDARDLLDTDAELLPGRDYYVYACFDDSDPAAIGFTLKVSLNSTYPQGWDEHASRKIGGFHTLCAAVGTIAGHPLSGFATGDILPRSFWCLTHRPWPASPEGMVYVPELDIWVDIYLQSGSGVLTKSVFGGTITNMRDWDSHNEDLRLTGKSMLSDGEFSMAMEGSNQKTAIVGAADPVTTGGHNDTAGRRMVSYCGVEDGCGAYLQWTDHPSVNGGSAWGAVGNKGSLYGTSYAMLAGGHWGHSSYCGSRCRSMISVRAITNAYIGGRGRARSL